MGTCYKGACHDCEQYIDLEKFYSLCLPFSAVDIQTEDLSEYYNEHFIYHTLRLHMFLGHHRGHRFGVYSEMEPSGQAIEDYQETFAMPFKKHHPDDVIDLRDVNVPRITLQTRHGEVHLDTRPDGLNCFRFVGGERIDTLLLGAKEGAAQQPVRPAQQDFY